MIYDVLVKNIGDGPDRQPGDGQRIPAAPASPMIASYHAGGDVNGAPVTPTRRSRPNPNQPVFTVPAAINGGKQLTITFRAMVVGQPPAGLVLQLPTRSPRTACPSPPARRPA